MISTRDGKPGPIEAWLTQGRIGITFKVVREDETSTEYDVDSPSMRGAQREATSWLVEQGYTPLGRWETTAGDDGEPTEAVRRFRPA